MGFVQVENGEQHLKARQDYSKICGNNPAITNPAITNRF